MKHSHQFETTNALQHLRHFLPAQAPLKDFIHHNTLHAFQDKKFFDGIRIASGMFGYKTSFSLPEYRSRYKEGQIREDILDRVILECKGQSGLSDWKRRALESEYNLSSTPRIGQLRANWKKYYHIDLDLAVQPLLFRIICSYLDQGISIWNFPVWNKGFLTSMRELERNTYSSFFKSKRAPKLLLDKKCEVKDLLDILVGDESLYEQYLYDQQFTHQGWSGMVCQIEENPGSLMEQRRIGLEDIVILELLLEIDALDDKYGANWPPLAKRIAQYPKPIFDEFPATELSELLEIWQKAYEWSYYDEVLAGIVTLKNREERKKDNSFQALFCIDDRYCSLRRYIEELDPDCGTYGTPGYFGVEFFFQPEHGKAYTKVCPAPITPKYLVKELGAKNMMEKDLHFTKHSHTLLPGAVISQTLGFWSAFKLFVNIFKPSISPATTLSFRHMDKHARLTIENQSPDDIENGLQIGFNIQEMADRVEGLLKSIGLVKGFAPIVYVIGHGASSVNNTHYAGYDCGACSGRPGSVNARVICYMANHPKVRENLKQRGIDIPEDVQFLGGLHDTTRDEIEYFDLSGLSSSNKACHSKNLKVFDLAMRLNAKERSRRFDSIDTSLAAELVHERVKLRSVSLFEPRPELNHATNTLCIIGRRSLTEGIFLDRRAFMNSYDYQIDPEGKSLFGIIKAAAPVCGGINLEYYFSRVDNYKLGAGTKLPHNVMGLIGVANGIDGDLRPGLPMQMVELHDPLRLLIIVEHFPEVVLDTIQQLYATYEWFVNEWVNLVVVHPETSQTFVFKGGGFEEYTPLRKQLHTVESIIPVLEKESGNITPVFIAHESTIQESKSCPV